MYLRFPSGCLSCSGRTDAYIISIISLDREGEKRRQMESYRHKVQYYETDKMGVTHHSNYIRWMEEARIDFLDRLGWNYARMEEMGVISPVTEVECKYKHSTDFSEEVYISVYVEEFKGVRMKLGYSMKNAVGTVVAVGRSEHCFIGRDGKLINMNKRYPEFCGALAAQANRLSPESI